jgi:hypothetical protein
MNHQYQHCAAYIPRRRERPRPVLAPPSTTPPSLSTPTLVRSDEDTRLVIGVGEEDLQLFGGEGGIAFDEGGHDTASSLDTEGKRGDVEKE